MGPDCGWTEIDILVLFYANFVCYICCHGLSFDDCRVQTSGNVLHDMGEHHKLTGQYHLCIEHFSKSFKPQLKLDSAHFRFFMHSLFDCRFSDLLWSLEVSRSKQSMVVVFRVLHVHENGTGVLFELFYGKGTLNDKKQGRDLLDEWGYQYWIFVRMYTGCVDCWTIKTKGNSLY